MNKELKKYSEYSDENVEWARKFPKHWNSTKLKHLCVLQRGFDLPSQERQEGKIPIYGGGGVTGYHSKAMVKPPGIVTGRYGTVGEIFLINEPFWPLNTSLYVKEFWGNFPGFIRYLLAVVPMQIYSEKAAVPGINRNIIHQIPVAIPPLEEQEAIAHYLDTKTAQIDRKIDLLTQKAQRYEELKRSLINETVTRGLDKSVPMKDSAIEWIGEIPEPWNSSRVKEQGSVRGRVGWKALKADEYVDEGYIFLSTPNIKGKEIDFENVNYITYERFIESPEIILNEKDILLAKDGSTLGIVNIVNSLPSEATVNSSIAVIRFRRSTHAKYFYYQFLSESIQTKISLKKIGMGVPHIFQRDINSFVLLLPPLDEQKAIAEYLDKKTGHIDQIIENINIQVEIQKELRKTLINDVVTGKIKVIDNGE